MARIRIKNLPLHWAVITPNGKGHGLMYRGRTFAIAYSCKDAIKRKKRELQLDRERKNKELKPKKARKK